MIDFLIYTGYLVLFLNLILYIFSFFRKKKANVFFVSYVAFASVMQFSLELMYHLKINNLFAINIFFVGQMLILGLFYKSILPFRKQKIFVNICLVAALLFLGIQFVMDSSQFLKFNLFEITLTSLLVVAFVLLHFYNILTEKKQYYYVSIGLVIYLLTSTVLYLIGNLSLGLSDNLKYLSWTLNAFLFVVWQLFILYEWKVSFYKKAALS